LGREVLSFQIEMKNTTLVHIKLDLFGAQSISNDLCHAAISTQWLIV